MSIIVIVVILSVYKTLLLLIIVVAIHSQHLLMSPLYSEQFPVANLEECQRWIRVFESQKYRYQDDGNYDWNGAHVEHGRIRLSPNQHVHHHGQGNLQGYRQRANQRGGQEDTVQPDGLTNDRPNETVQEQDQELLPVRPLKRFHV